MDLVKFLRIIEAMGGKIIIDFGSNGKVEVEKGEPGKVEGRIKELCLNSSNTIPKIRERCKTNEQVLLEVEAEGRGQIEEMHSSIPNHQPEMLDAEEVAAILGLSVSTILYHTRKGEIKWACEGGRGLGWWFEKSYIEKLKDNSPFWLQKILARAKKRREESDKREGIFVRERA